MGSRRLGRTAVAAAIAGVTAIVLACSAGVAGHSSTTAVAKPLGAGPLHGKAFVQPTPTSTCKATPPRHFRCYSPAQFENAYDMAGLHGAGIDGSGETIAIVDSFGSPTIANDVHQFDQIFGVSNPYGIPIDPAIATDPVIQIIQPAGPVPPFDPSDSDMVGWAQETTLDVEWAHVFAPKAKILLVETPVSETEGVTGFPEIVKAENYVIDNHLANVISQSFGATEETFPNTQIPEELRSAFKNAQHNGVTVLGASGDEGSTDFELNIEDLYPMQVNSWPSSDPLVTSVGGTQANLDDAGTRLTPDVVWNDSPVGVQAASGGGVSHIFNRPDFQDGVKSLVGNARGTPDISLNAAVDGGVWVYYTFVIPPSGPWHIFGGTSAAAPEFAGVVAMADQVAGQGLGLINKPLYSMSYGSGLVDVTQGNNDIGPFTNSDGITYHVPGYDAGPGYDLATGLGTLDAGKFVPVLANLAGSASANVTCTGTLNYTSVRGNLRVPRGASCTVNNSAISGNVDVEPGGLLKLNGDTIKGNVQLQNEPAGAANVICGSSIGGNLQAHDNRNETVIGTLAGTCSAGNSIGGNTQVQNNRVTSGPSVVIAGNTIGGNLDCSNNRPAATGGGNTVLGHKQGECAGL